MPNGSRYWRLKYRFGGKEKRLAFGVYPEVTLADAREKRDAARKLLAADIAPALAGHERKNRLATNAANTFEVVALEWHEQNLEKWTPKQVISDLPEVDPDADVSARISFGIEETLGVPAKEMKYLGEDHRFSLSWANKNHIALGNFLQALTMSQLEQGKSQSKGTMLDEAQEVIVTLQQILESPVFNVNFGQFYQLQCSCGIGIKRRKGSFGKQKCIICPKCKAIHDLVEMKEDGGGVFQIRMAEYACRICNQKNTVSSSQIVEGQISACPGCKNEVRVVKALALEDVKNANEQS